MLQYILYATNTTAYKISEKMGLIVSGPELTQKAEQCKRGRMQKNLKL